MNTNNVNERLPALQRNDEEIDLFDLCGLLWKKKLLILIVTIIVMMAGISVAFLFPKTRDTEVVLRPANLVQLMPVSNYFPLYRDADNMSDQKQPSYVGLSLHIYEIYYKALLTDSLLHIVYEQHLHDMGAPSTFKEFKKRLFITRNTATIAGDKSLTIKYNAKVPEQGVNFLNNKLLPAIKHDVQQQLKENIAARIKNEKEWRLKKIEKTQQEFLYKNRQHEKTLANAFDMAKNAGINKPALQDTSRLDVSANPHLLFLIGTNALSLLLKQNKSIMDEYYFINDSTALVPRSINSKPLVPGVETDYAYLVYLNQINADLSLLNPINIINPAKVVMEKPSNTLIITLSIFLGLILSIFMALTKIALEKRKLIPEIGSQSDSSCKG